MNRFLPHFRSSSNFSLVCVNGANDCVWIALIILPCQILTRFQLHLNPLVLVVGVCVRNAKKVARWLLMAHVVVADYRDVLLAAWAWRCSAVRGMQELWRFVVRCGGNYCCRVVVTCRLKVLFTVIVGIIENFNFDVSHSLNLWVIVNWSQRKPVVLVIV